MVMNQIYPFLLNSAPGSADPEPDIAESAEFTSPTEYTVKLKPGLKWANGHDLDLLGRQVHASTARSRSTTPTARPRCWATSKASSAPDATTVVFKLKAGNDQTFAQILSSPAGPIVDEEVFSADAMTPRRRHRQRQGLRRPVHDRQLQQERADQPTRRTRTTRACSAPPKTDTVNVKYYADAINMKLDIQQGNIDVAFRSLTATDIDGPARGRQGQGRRRPRRRDPLHRLQLRHHAVRRQDRRGRPGQGAGRPPGHRRPDGPPGDRGPGLQGHLHARCTPTSRRASPGRSSRSRTSTATATAARRGQGQAGPRRRPASPPRSTLNLQYNPDHYGPSSGDEYAHDQEPAGEGRPVQGEPAVHRVGHVLQGPHRRRLPDLPAGLVPGLLRR